MDFDAETVERVNISWMFSLKQMKSGWDNMAGQRLLYLTSTLELKGNTFVWNHTLRFLCIVFFPGKVKVYSLSELVLSVTVFI